MCISKPQMVISYGKGKAVVDFEGTKKTVSSPVDWKPGDWVLCQAGLVAKKITKKQAQEMLKEWRVDPANWNG